MNILQVTLQVVTSHEGSFLAATHKIKTWNNDGIMKRGATWAVSSAMVVFHTT